LLNADVRWLVRKTLVLVLLFASPVALACASFLLLPPELENASPEERHRYEWQTYFKRADVVIEAVVLTVEEMEDSRAARVRVIRTWKTDGQPLKVIQSGLDSCGTGFGVGYKFIIFAHRSTSFWSFLPWTTDPLYTGAHTTIYVGQDALTDVDELVAVLDRLAKAHRAT
jgi:hypothetical protein